MRSPNTKRRSPDVHMHEGFQGQARRLVNAAWEACYAGGPKGHMCVHVEAGPGPEASDNFWKPAKQEAARIILHGTESQAATGGHQS